MSVSSIFTKDYFTNSKISKYHFRVLLCLTLLMVVIASICVIPGVIDHPQFATNSSYDWETILIKNQTLYAYQTFFILDFIWSFLLLWIIWKLVKKFILESNLTRFNELCFNVFSVIVVLAWLFDVIENYFYLIHFKYIPSIVTIKTILYIITLLTALIIIAYQYFQASIPTFIGFLKSSIYSLVILAVIGVFLPKAPQVNSIIVNLYESPFNFLIILLMAPTYAVVLAHYPSYFNISNNTKDWYRAKIKLGLLGTIFYKKENKKTQINIKEKPVTGYLNFLFRILGILFYCALFYVIGYTSEINFDWKASISHASIALLGIGIFMLYYFREKKNEWLDINFEYLKKELPGFYDGDYTLNKNEIIPSDTKEELNIALKSNLSTEERDKELKKINKWINQYLIALGFTVLMHIFLFVLLCFYTELGFESKYSCVTAIVSLFCIGLQMITYIYYRTFRSVFRFSFYDEGNYLILNAFFILRVIHVIPKEDTVSKAEIKKNKNKIISFFNKHDFLKNQPHFKFFRALSFGALSNNIVYLQVTIFIGIINAFFLLIINVFDSVALSFNPILIILSYFFLFYGIIVGLTKNFIYYKYSHEVFARKNMIKFNFLLVISFLILFGANRLGRIYSNDLFTLHLIESTSKQDVSLEEYVGNLKKDSTTTRYYIGAYGGGMKANAWTLTVLNRLNVKGDFFKKTIGISGASGGTMGLINMAAIINGEKDKSLWKQYIEKISTSNILSLDITHILGRDSFNHMFVPFIDLKGYDRSTKAMNIYAKYSGNEDQVCKPSTYRSFWKKLYNNQGNHFPILISNSTNVLGNQGMAISVKVEDANLKSLLYHGADNILDINKNIYKEKQDYSIKKEKLTLSYYDAASTSNRFPVISPAAKIETIGHFNDGGIYENSGLLSVYKLFRTINYQENNLNNYKGLKQKNVFINIVNDKKQYIKYTVEKYVKRTTGSDIITVNRINNNTEINAILGSISSTEMMPIHIKTELERLAKNDTLIEFETIYLPHRFNVIDIKSIYGESIDFGKGMNAANNSMYQCVIENDSIIRQAVKGIGPIIEPPMSRMITKQAYSFMNKMLEHETTNTAINKILNY